ncbi:MAG TPA: hypothetical protein VLL97_05920 [Acidobacteriota bacterium]|nr:hypothetical protein [Acidobacteriota bacterium]
MDAEIRRFFLFALWAGPRAQREWILSDWLIYPETEETIFGTLTPGRVAAAEAGE